MPTLDEFKNETWEDEYQDHRCTWEQVVGNSGVYLVIVDKATGETLRDDRPWQMREGQS